VVPPATCFDLKKTDIVPVEHHLAHAASAYHCAGFKEKTAILGIDGKGEYATPFFGYGENGRIHKLKEFYDPDSLGGLLWRSDRVSRFRDARRRVQGNGHGALRRS
jgi:predicted NodU family carbamoyl transferase